MKIEHAELYRIEVPLPAPLRVAAHPGSEQTSNIFTFVRLITDDGIVGESAGPTMGALHAGLGETFAQFLLGRDPFDILGMQDLMETGTVIGMRLALLEPALWDIMGKACGQPVYRMLGAGGRDKIRAYWSTSELREPAERAEQLLEMRERGFKAVKLRAHRPEWRDDIKVIDAARKAVGDSMEIMVDANQAFRLVLVEHDEGPRWDLETATEVARAMEEYDVYWLEEPLDRTDYEGLRELRQRTSLRIAGGELIWQLSDYVRLIDERCYDILQPDAAIFGGISVSRKVGVIADAHNLGLAPHTWTTGIGLLANMQVMASSPNCEWCEFPYEPPGWTVEARDGILAENITVDSDGWVHMPDRPGLGIVVDEDRLKRYGRKIFPS
jgi:L-alanine-DL-glutamate epimerase-like enolase superfamily enzyme